MVDLSNGDTLLASKGEKYFSKEFNSGIKKGGHRLLKKV